MIRNRIVLTALGLVLAGSAFAVVQHGLLHPEMTPEQGTFDAPMGTLGAKPSAPWSSTTLEAAVAGKANPAKIVTVVGEVVDYSCYLQVGKHGGKHRDCGQKCARNGMPIGLVTKDGKLFLLMEEEHHPRRDGKTIFREAAIDHMAHVMEITGTESTVDGQHALFVTGFVK